jgi:penicillin-binding protein 1B
MWRRIFLTLTIALCAVAAYGLYLGLAVTSEFDRRGWDRPARIYAAPLELYAGRRLSQQDLAVELDRLGYRKSASVQSVATYAERNGRSEVWTRPFEHIGFAEPARRLTIDFERGYIAALRDSDGNDVALAQLDPLLIGSVFPAHGEDRIVAAPDEIPTLLTEALKAVEDRRFESHLGIDLRAVLRAALVNVTSGEIRQGGSTLTQQLVRSYFLSNDRTWRRKISEALMAVALELRHDKAELMHAYINEIYLGQDGGRAIHGFGLASRFYFGKPLSELELHEIGMLIAQVRGPSYYDPRRHPERALQRRNLVLTQMRDFALISDTEYTAATKRELGVLTAANRRSSYYAAFLDLVRRQLRRDYSAADLEQTGLRVFSTLDPAVQSTAEVALIEELERLQDGRPELEGAVVVTSPHNAEVRAIVGSRRTGYDGFNRALDAKRQVGSLIKPAVYLAALESGRHSLASLIDDEPVAVPLDTGETWTPNNFTEETHGTVTAVRALAESFNLATVDIGLDVGLPAVADALTRLGLEQSPRLYPSLLLGALEMTPLEVTQIYNSLANGGFRMPLRAVRAVVTDDGETVTRYGLEIEQASDPTAVFALNQALVQVMERGTGRTARRQLPAELVTAGKTGTSDGLRDSWFAGFNNDQLIVAWVGNDDNVGVNLTGGAGASRVWARTMRELGGNAYNALPPSDAATAWVDYNTGLVTDPACPDAVFMSQTGAELPPKAVACGSDRVRIGSRIRRWLRKTLD